jgi:hypothetical protein
MSLVPSVPAGATPVVGLPSSSFTIKLNNKNYLSWKTQFGPLLKLHKLNGLIDGTTVAPPLTIPTSPTDLTPLPNPDYDEWLKKDKMLHSWLLSSLSEDVFPFVIGLQSSHEVWTALASAFGTISQNRQLQLHIELQELKKGGLTVSSICRRLRGWLMNSPLLVVLSLKPNSMP